MNRAKHERQIKFIDADGGVRADLFGEAVSELAFRHGLSWFTDKQIAELRDHMLAAAASRRSRMNERVREARARLDNPNHGAA